MTFAFFIEVPETVISRLCPSIDYIPEIEVSVSRNGTWAAYADVKCPALSIAICESREVEQLIESRLAL